MQNTQQIRTAVIPAGGWGSRMLPTTVVIPKQLLPVYNKPAVQIVVEEAAAAGLEQIIFVTTDNQHGLIENHFTPSRRLMERSGDSPHLQELLRLREKVSIQVVDQGEALGLGHAILCTESVVGDEPFVVMLPDDLVDPATPCLPRMIKAFEHHQGSVLSLLEVPREQVSSYGVVAGEWINEAATTFKVANVVEKPKPELAPSNQVIVGRYVLPPSIFNILRETKPSKGGEILLTDALLHQALAGHCYGVRLDGKRYDVGSPLGLLWASLAFAFKDNEAGPMLRDLLNTLL